MGSSGCQSPFVLWFTWGEGAVIRAAGTSSPVGNKERNVPTHSKITIAHSDTTRAFSRDSKSLMTWVSRLIKSLPTSSRYCPKRAGLFACPGVRRDTSPFAPAPGLTNGYPCSRLCESRAEGVRTPLAERVFASDGLHKEYSTSS